jgi:hypothetical protein
MKLFKIDESYIIRHKILEELFKSAQKEIDEQRPENRLSLSCINKLTKIDSRKLFLYHELLHEENEIHCEYDCDSPNEHFLLIESKGRQSYIYEKYLKDGLAEAKKELKDKIDILTPLLSTLIAVAALIISIISLNSTSHSNNEENSKSNKSQKIKSTETIIEKNAKK